MGIMNFFKKLFEPAEMTVSRNGFSLTEHGKRKAMERNAPIINALHEQFKRHGVVEGNTRGSVSLDKDILENLKKEK